MSETPIYTEYHPRWYRRRVSTYWWMQRWSYFAFILRELSSLFIVWFVVFTLLQVRALSRGPESYQQFQAWLKTPAVLVLNVVSLFFVVFHSITWFNLAPKAMVVRLRGKRVPSFWVAAPNFIAWALASALVAWIILKR
jgi:fumarate reductase subunit C